MQYVSQKARFSPDSKYRYSLSRSWQGGQGKAVFIGLNPSTADTDNDDPTIRRCVNYARSWGFASMEIVNLFALGATDPSRLRQTSDPIGPENDDSIAAAINTATVVIACWGNSGSYLDRDEQIKQRFKGLMCLRLTNKSQPAHPLYQQKNLIPLAFN